MIHRFFAKRPVATGAAILASTQLLASVAGLIRDRMLASTFPPGVDALDTVSLYIAAFRPSDLLFQLFIMSMFSVALVPMLAGYLAHDKEEEMDRLLSSVLVLTNAFFGIVTIFFIVFFDSIAPFLVDFEGDALIVYIRFAKIACFTNLLFVSGNAFGQYLITRRSFLSYGITPILYTVGTILGTIFLTSRIGVFGPIVGTVFGGVVYFLIRMESAIRNGFRFRLPKLFHPGLSEMGFLMLPRMAALGALQFQLLLFDKVASGLPLGSVTINAYARNCQAAGAGLIGVALAQSIFSLLSQSIAKKQVSEFWRTFRKGAGLTLVLSVIASIALVLLSRVAAWLLGLTEPGVVEVFTSVVVIYAISIPFDSFNHLLFRSIYATKHTVVPAIASVSNAAISIGLAWLLAPTFGVKALAIGFLVGQFVQTTALTVFLLMRVRRMREE